MVKYIQYPCNSGNWPRSIHEPTVIGCIQGKLNQNSFPFLFDRGKKHEQRRQSDIQHRAVLLCGSAIRAAEPASIGNLTKTSVKISEIDMDKDFGKAGSLLDSFYTGTLIKRNQESSVVYTDRNAPAKPSASAKAICNAKPYKIVLSGKVPPPHTTYKSNRENPNLPLAAGGLILGGVSLLAAASGKKKSYMDDVETVWNAIQHPVDTYNDINNYNGNIQNYNNSTNQNNNSSNQNGSTSNPYEVEQDAATTLHCDPTGTCTQ